MEQRKVKMIAHRGYSRKEQENTYPAFVAAGNRSYYGMEGDVRQTKDGVFCMLHDETLTRVSGGASTLSVRKSNWKELERILLPDMDGSRTRQDIRIPTLSDYIGICEKYRKVCVLELKERMTEQELTALIRQIQGEGDLSRVIFISFFLSNCMAVRKMRSEQEVQWLTMAPLAQEIIGRLAAQRIDLDVEYRHLTADAVEEAHAKGLKVNAWTCDDRADAEELKKMGVDFITTNILE